MDSNPNKSIKLARDALFEAAELIKREFNIEDRWMAVALDSVWREYSTRHNQTQARAVEAARGVYDGLQ